MAGSGSALASGRGGWRKIIRRAVLDEWCSQARAGERSLLRRELGVFTSGAKEKEEKEERLGLGYNKAVMMCGAVALG